MFRIKQGVARHEQMLGSIKSDTAISMIIPLRGSSGVLNVTTQLYGPRGSVTIRLEEPKRTV